VKQSLLAASQNMKKKNGIYIYIYQKKFKEAALFLFSRF
jgi:hypothetical protein